MCLWCNDLKRTSGGIFVTLDSLISDMIGAAERYPGINLIWYRTAVEATVTIVSVFVGIILVLLCMAVPLILAAELMFINFPPLTAMLLEQEDVASSAGVEKKKRNWGLFLNDARRALRLHGEKGGNVNTHYFSVKWKMLLIMTSSINVLFFGSENIIRWITLLVGELLKRIALA